MYYIVETSKPFAQAAEDLDAAVKAHQFGVLHVHDIGNTLRSKGVEFAEQCKVFEVCNPKQAAKVMSADMSMNMALPCRISVYTEKGKTLILRKRRSACCRRIRHLARSPPKWKAPPGR